MFFNYQVFLFLVQVQHIHQSVSLGKMLAKSLVNMLAKSLVNMLPEVLLNVLAKSMVKM